MRTKKTSERSGRDVDPGDAKRSRPRNQRRSGAIVVSRDGRVKHIFYGVCQAESDGMWLKVRGGRVVISEG